jgi:DNA-binding NtrC family response regulator
LSTSSPQTETLRDRAAIAAGPSPVTALVADDEYLIRWSLRQMLEAEGHRVVEASTGAEAIRLGAAGVDVVLLDYRLPDTDGLTVLKHLKADQPDTPIILITAFSTVERAVDAMKLGAYHFVTKPFDVNDVSAIVSRALENTNLRREVRALRARQTGDGALENIAGASPPMREVRALIAKYARSATSTVLITGESGTGKDLAARALHSESGRARGPFMNITCSAMPESLLESELFGHERGAFTDARQQKKGLFELAHGGTVFLDEIGELTPAMQAKLLRFLEDRVLRRVGGVTEIRPDVRVIAATNRDLRVSVAEKEFRSDLYYRLSVLQMQMPALRDRPEDIALLAKFFVDRFNCEFRKSVSGISPDAVRLLESHSWPGNVRELRNVTERAVLLAETDRLEPSDFAGLHGGPREADERVLALPPGGVDLQQLERDLVVQALARAGNNQTRAARLLGISRDQVRYRMEKFGLR